MLQIANKGKYLMMFNDRSASMKGDPFMGLLRALVNKNIKELIFKDRPFEKIETVFYGDDI